MADVFTKAKRSQVMSRIRGRGNKDTELALAALLRADRISGWRRHVRVAVDGSGLRVDSGRKPRRTPPQPYPQRGEGVRRRIAQPSTLNAQLTVRPDFVFRKLRAVIFVDGCFWHGCPKHCNPMKWLKKSSMSANNPPSPKGRRWRTGRAFWRKKLAANQRRDALVTRTLRRSGWRVLRVWEHELARKNEARLIRRLFAFMGK